ncbi:MauE/DoxX family redox-associated membrane protein [Streptomyces phaeochromogenes]|uniref:MauE/DoxX family redox-associated membrane protein n=1 Tax=Streptomyces phaeochromogenes TaxID=1923 RepID=UPI0036A72A5A
MQTAILMLIGRLVLAGVFLLAGLTKLIDRSGTQEAARALGVPTAVTGVTAAILPPVEIAVAISLLPATSALWGAMGALGLLLAFSIAILAALARGQRPPCHCFGQIQAKPLGWITLVRNLVFAGIAVFVVLVGSQSPTYSAVSWVSDLSVAEATVLAVALAVLVIAAVQGWFLLHLLRQHGRILARLDALEVGHPAHPERLAPPLIPQILGLPLGGTAPEFMLQDLNDEPLTLATLRAADKPVLLLFADAACGPCNALLPEIGHWQSAHASVLTVAMVGSGSREELREKAREHELVTVLIQQSQEVAEAYQSAGTPSAVVVSPDGRIASTLATGAASIRQLVRDFTSTAPPVKPRPASSNGAQRSTRSPRFSS